MGIVLDATNVMQLHAWSAKRLAMEALPAGSAVLRMADDEGLLPRIFDRDNAVMVMDQLFHDCEQYQQNVPGPRGADADDILDFYNRANAEGVEHFIAQCQAGIGRSVAVCLALQSLDLGRIVSGYAGGLHTYNRRLYNHLLRAGGMDPPRQPLVSIAVRAKYAADRLELFLLSMRRQRHQNWEAVVFTDGPDSAVDMMVALFNDERIRCVQTPERKGRWGHPYRQLAFEQCRGDWIGTQNDDNYLTPGFIEQLVHAAEERGANIAMCQPLHRYSGWSPTEPGTDLCTWIARRELVQQVPWTGTGFEADAEYLSALRQLPGAKTVALYRPLVVKN